MLDSKNNRKIIEFFFLFSCFRLLHSVFLVCSLLLRCVEISPFPNLLCYPQLCSLEYFAVCSSIISCAALCELFFSSVLSFPEHISLCYTPSCSVPSSRFLLFFLVPDDVFAPNYIWKGSYNYRGRKQPMTLSITSFNSTTGRVNVSLSNGNMELLLSGMFFSG